MPPPEVFDHFHRQRMHVLHDPALYPSTMPVPPHLMQNDTWNDDKLVCPFRWRQLRAIHGSTPGGPSDIWYDDARVQPGHIMVTLLRLYPGLRAYSPFLQRQQFASLDAITYLDICTMMEKAAEQDPSLTAWTTRGDTRYQPPSPHATPPPVVNYSRHQLQHIFKSAHRVHISLSAYPRRPFLPSPDRVTHLTQHLLEGPSFPLEQEDTYIKLFQQVPWEPIYVNTSIQPIPSDYHLHLPEASYPNPADRDGRPHRPNTPDDANTVFNTPYPTWSAYAHAIYSQQVQHDLALSAYSDYMPGVLIPYPTDLSLPGYPTANDPCDESPDVDFPPPPPSAPPPSPCPPPHPLPDCFPIPTPWTPPSSPGGGTAIPSAQEVEAGDEAKTRRGVTCCIATGPSDKWPNEQDEEEAYTLFCGTQDDSYGHPIYTPEAYGCYGNKEGTAAIMYESEGQVKFVLLEDEEVVLEFTYDDMELHNEPQGTVWGVERLLPLHMLHTWKDEPLAAHPEHTYVYGDLVVYMPEGTQPAPNPAAVLLIQEVHGYCVTLCTGRGSVILETKDVRPLSAVTLEMQQWRNGALLKAEADNPHMEAPLVLTILSPLEEESGNQEIANRGDNSNTCPLVEGVNPVEEENVANKPTYDALRQIGEDGFSRMPSRLIGREQQVFQDTRLDDNLSYRHDLTTSILRMHLPEGTPIMPVHEQWVKDPDLQVQLGDCVTKDAQRMEELQTLLVKNKSCFAFSLEDIREGYKGSCPHPSIEQVPGKYSRVGPRKLSEAERRIQDHANLPLLELGIIERSPSAKSATNPVFAWKKGLDGTPTDVRVCYNYVGQNNCSRSVHTSFPLGEELFQSLGGATVYSRVDLRSGFHQIPLREDSRDYAAFWWGTDLYRPTRVVFGLKQAPAWFQAVMEYELGRANLHCCCRVFIDDVLVFSNSWEEHLQDLDRLFRMFAETNLKVHPEKSAFAATTIDFLGFNVSNFGLTPQQAKIEAFAQLPAPKCLLDLQVILGKLRYYACFVVGFSRKAQPMVQLLKKDSVWNWTPECQQAFDGIKADIATPGRALKRFDHRRPIFVHTDWSNKGLGAVLAQTGDDNLEYIVACISRSLNRHEGNYSAYKGEMLAAVWAVKTLAFYVNGHRFTLVTDHQPLVYLLTAPNLSGVLARWACILQAQDMEIVHRSGEANQNADALSRFPLPTDKDTTGARMDLEEDAFACLPIQELSTTPIRLLTRPRAKELAGAIMSGVALLELCGGICTGLEAALRNGLVVQRYVYADKDKQAQLVAKHRVRHLQKNYPGLFPEVAAHQAFNHAPMDILTWDDYSLDNLGIEDPLQWMIIAGPECQDFSPAGANKGLSGARSQVFMQVLRIVDAFQARAVTQPLYIVENAAMQHNWRSAEVRVKAFQYVCTAMGRPVLVDAPSLGSYAHRLRNFWQNLAEAGKLEAAIQTLHPPSGTLVQDILDDGRFPMPVDREDHAPFFLANQVGQPRRVLPTLVAYPMSRAFRQGAPGSIYDTNLGWTEPNPDERERALGFPPGATQVPGLSQQDRHRLTGNAIDLRVLTGLIRTAIIMLPSDKHKQLIYIPVPHAVKTTLRTRSLQPPDGMASVLSLTLAVQASAGSELLEQLEELSESSEESLSHNQPKDSITESGPVIGARWHQQNADPDPLDITLDIPTLEYLKTGALPTGSLTPASLRRLLRRASSYRFVEDDLYRRMSNGQLRKVPSLEDRQDIVVRFHTTAGHFGVKRTLHLLMTVYTWPQMAAQVKQIVQSCDLCQRARASFSAQSTELHPHPVTGMFHTWGVDLSGPYTKSRRGYAYLMHAVEHQIHLMVTIPITEKDSQTTAFAFMQHVICQYGACAVVVTDSGTEFQGEFDDLCTTLRIDHRVVATNNPQGNGLTERAVGTVKRGLAKMMEGEQCVTDWDYYALRMTLAYNLSPQETTRIAPYYLLYAREPLFPSQEAQPFLETLPDHDWNASLASRAQYLERVMPTIANHLAIAKHRDTLRYAYTRTGAFRPQSQRFAVGDYVYIRRPQDSKTQLEAQPKILQIKRLTTTGTIELMGRCGQSATTHVRNVAPCHLPHIDGRVVPGLARPTVDHPCEICSLPDRASEMLLCDSCNSGYHMSCLTPPLTKVPTGEWYCPVCAAKEHYVPAATNADIQQAQAKQQDLRAYRALHRRDPKPSKKAGRALRNK